MVALSRPQPASNTFNTHFFFRMNSSLAHDLALKAATHTPFSDRPTYAWRECVPTDAPLLPAITLLAPTGETSFDLGEIAETLGNAITNVHLARGEKGNIFTPETKGFVGNIIKEVAANLSAQALKKSPLKVSLNDLYELIEKTLVDNNAYDVAKSLLLNRSRKLADGTRAATTGIRVIRRSNHVVPYIDQKVEIAVRKSFLSLQQDSAAAIEVTKAVTTRVLGSKQSFVHIEEIQDIVQEELMKAGHFKVAEAYILYRAQRNDHRDETNDNDESDEADLRKVAAANQPAMIMVKQLDGSNKLWDREDLKKRIEFGSIGLNLCLTAEEIFFFTKWTKHSYF